MAIPRSGKREFVSREIDHLLDDLRRGEFHIDCVRMELVRASDGKSYVGPGYIRQKPTHEFEIKIYAEGMLSYRDAMSPWIMSEAGVLFTEENHFSLAATDGRRPVAGAGMTGGGNQWQRATGVLNFWWIIIFIQFHPGLTCELLPPRLSIGVQFLVTGVQNLHQIIHRVFKAHHVEFNFRVR